MDNKGKEELLCLLTSVCKARFPYVCKGERELVDDKMVCECGLVAFKTPVDKEKMN